MKKSVYLFFCAVLGALLLLVIERAFSLLYFLLYNVDYGRYGLNLSIDQVQGIDLIILIGAVLLGGIYGLWLGGYWYAYVYEGGTEIPSQPIPAPAKKEPVSAAGSARRRPTRFKSQSFDDKEPMGAWEVEDLMKVNKTRAPAVPVPAPEILSIDHSYDDQPAVTKTQRKAKSASASAKATADKKPKTKI